MFKRLFNWLTRNKMLLVFVLFGLGTSFSAVQSLIKSGGAVDANAKTVKLMQYNINGTDNILFSKQGSRLIAQIKKPMTRDGQLGDLTIPFVEEGAFNAILHNKGSQPAETYLVEEIQQYLPEMVAYQRKIASRLKLGYAPVFGVSKYREVENLKINGQRVGRVTEVRGERSDRWYIWFFADLELKESGNTVEIAR